MLSISDTVERQKSIWELLGGTDGGAADAFAELVDRFYDGIETDPIIRPMYPDDDMPGARERLALFLIQYFGGPAIYSEQHGHPRLRMRHAPYKVDTKAADAWLSHMDKALETTPAFAPYVDGMKEYFHHTAYFLRNTQDSK